MTITINQITSGMGLRVDNNIYVVADYSHVKPGKGSAFVRVKLKNLKSGLVIERTFKSSEKLDDIFLEDRILQFLYRSGKSLHLMDQSTFEEQIVSEDLMGNDIKYLQDNLDVTGHVYEGQVLKISLPNFIKTQIVETEPGVKGDSARAGTKPAKIDSGADIQVPLFIGNEEWIKVDTRTGTYVERVRK
ncbi:MAG: elongation factor P [Candidatus Aceula lacicola]|nr:elongation factor P [Candidatus Aceula lacicola]